MRALLTVALVASLAFAGCTSNDADPEPTGSSSTSASSTSSSSTTSSTASQSSTGTSSPGGAENQPPTGSITLSNVTDFQVSFALDGSDPDGDALTWSLAFGDNATDATGTSLPANVTHTYASAGNFTAVFTLSDGQAHLVANYTVSLQPSGEASYPPPVVFTGSSIGGPPVGCLGSMGLNTVYHDFDPALAGVWKYKVTPGTGWVTEWWVGDSTATDGGGEGTIPSGHDNVAVCPSTPSVPAKSYTLTLYHPDGPAPT